jgi:uncharacterized protein (DUF488 family)
MGMKIVTIGVYGTSEDAFFDALQTAGVDLFVDVRWRRGLRGAQYAFANYKRLHERLKSIGIDYVHRRDLAPTPEIRRVQQESDQQNRIAKRQRAELSPAFVTAYQGGILAEFDPQAFLVSLPDGVKVVALFCVEREPSACHRLLIADKLREHTGIEIEHLLPS